MGRTLAGFVAAAVGMMAWTMFLRQRPVAVAADPPHQDASHAAAAIVAPADAMRQLREGNGRFVDQKANSAHRDAARRALKSKLDLPNGLPPAPIDELALELLGLGGEAARQPGLFVARARQLA